MVPLLVFGPLLERLWIGYGDGVSESCMHLVVLPILLELIINPKMQAHKEVKKGVKSEE